MRTIRSSHHRWSWPQASRGASPPPLPSCGVRPDEPRRGRMRQRLDRAAAARASRARRPGRARARNRHATAAARPAPRQRRRDTTKSPHSPIGTRVLNIKGTVPFRFGPRPRAKLSLAAHGSGDSAPYSVAVVREERGQTAAEFMGILLLVSAIIAALVTTPDAGAKIAERDQAARVPDHRRRLRGRPAATPGPARPWRQRPRRAVADRPPVRGPAVPGLGHDHLHLRRARPAEVRAEGRHRRLGPGQRRAEGRAHADDAGRQRLPVAEPLDRRRR